MEKSKPAKIPLILDTDMSPDSWAALLFLAKHPNVDLLAVSISGTGEAHGKNGARNAARLLALAGGNDIRIGFGQPNPLKGKRHFPGLMRFVIDHLFFIQVPQLSQYPQFEDSVKMISSILTQSKEKVKIAAVGPQTNMARVLIEYPQTKEKIDSISVMGGAVDVPGNIRDVGFFIDNAVAEWNFFCDPLAAQSVFHSGVKVQLVSLDVTNQVPVTKPFLEKFGKNANNQSAKFVLAILNRIVGKFRKNVAFYLWDPMTCATAVDSELCEFSEENLDVIIEPGKQWAGIIKSESGNKIFAAKKIDKTKFENNLINILCS